MKRASPRSGIERGSILVEFSFVSILLVALVLGIFEIGGVWSNHHSVSNAARAGARVGSQMAVDGAADSEMLLAVEAALGSLGDDLSRVVIYEADINGNMPSACLTATAGYSGGAHCNVYDSNSMDNLATLGWWGSGTSCGTADDNWCAASDRDSAQDTATYLGVHVEIEHQYMTNFFGTGTLTMSDITVMRLEPED